MHHNALRRADQSSLSAETSIRPATPPAQETSGFSGDAGGTATPPRAACWVRSTPVQGVLGPQSQEQHPCPSSQTLRVPHSQQRQPKLASNVLGAGHGQPPTIQDAGHRPACLSRLSRLGRRGTGQTGVRAQADGAWTHPPRSGSPGHGSPGHGPPPTAMGWLTTPVVSAAALDHLGPHPLLQQGGLALEDPWVDCPTPCAPQNTPAEEGLGAKSRPSGPCPHFCLTSLLEGLRVQKHS